MYNTDPVNIDQAKQIAKLYIAAGIIPLFVGEPGCGKTTLTKDIAREMGAELRTLRLNNMPPEESLGLQYIDHEDKTTIRYAPKWVPKDDGSEGEIVVFLDEFMQAQDENRKGIMSALLERYIGDHKLPDNCFFIAAGNSVEDGSNVFEMDRATADRFGIILIRTDFEIWANGYAKDHDLDLSILGYLRVRPDHFSDGTMRAGQGDDSENDNVIRPSARTWVSISNIMKNGRKNNCPDEIIKAAIMGKLGNQITESFWQVVGKLSGVPGLEQMLAMKPKKRAKHTPKEMEILWALGQSMIWNATSAKKIDQILELFDDMEPSSDIPFIETRTHIVENMLSHAVNIHGVSTADEPAIAKRLVKWHKAMTLTSADNDQIPATREIVGMAA